MTMTKGSPCRLGLRFVAAGVGLFVLLSTASVQAEDHKMIEVTRVGAVPPTKGPAEFFTGTVRIDSLFGPHDPSRVSGGTVTFEPGARTHWHTHPSGQTLIVTAGAGKVQQWDSPVQDIRPGDVVWIPPGVKHWHGAAATTPMTHIAIQEYVEGTPVTWLEPVTDGQYPGTR